MVAQDDGAPLTRVSGIGKKTAQKIFLDLKYKMKDEAAAFAGKASAGPSQGGNPLVRDVLATLVGMGVDEVTAQSVLAKLQAEDPGMDEKMMLSRAFRIIGGGK